MPPGERDLERLVREMTPLLDPEDYVFCAEPKTGRASFGAMPLMIFAEEEGLSLILRKSDAEAAGIPFHYPCKRITLAIHSSLEAVGFLAAVATRLAAAGISANAVSAFYHDHLFVPADRAEEAMRVLREMAG